MSSNSSLGGSFLGINSTKGFLGTGLLAKGASTPGGIKGRVSTPQLETIQRQAAKSGIDELTKSEIAALSSDQTVSYDNLLTATSLFQGASEGTLPKFKSRMETQLLFNTLVDRPDQQRLRGQMLDFGKYLRK